MNSSSISTAAPTSVSRGDLFGRRRRRHGHHGIGRRSLRGFTFFGDGGGGVISILKSKQPAGVESVLKISIGHLSTWLLYFGLRRVQTRGLWKRNSSTKIADRMAEKSVGGGTRILVVGATGNLGRHLVEASIASGRPTFALARDSAFSDPDKSRFLRSIAQRGVTLLKGCLEDFDGLLDAVRKVDVVISAVSAKQVLDQKLLVRAIKQAGTVKRFVPAEFGADADKVEVNGSDYEFYKRKVEIRRLIEKEGIPHTYVCCGFYTSYLLPSLVQPGLARPPRDRVKIFGNGDTKAVFVKECDVASYTVCTVDDPRSLNKTLHLRPPGNICSMNDLVEMWEMKIGKKLEREYVPEERLLKIIQDTPHLENLSFLFIYFAFVKGGHTNFNVDPSSGLDGAHAYPHVKHTTVDQHLNTLLS